MNAIKTDKLTKYYGKARGIIEVDLTVEEGDFFGFIGPNGSGKSTTIRTLLGLISATSGSASVLGLDVATQRTEILQNIGYLPSETFFYSGMKVKDIIEFSAKLRGRDCSAEAKRLCERLQLDTTRKINELSLGNRKKVGIVCALQHNPKLYILDEPTSGLDPLMQHEIYEVLKERNSQGATIFLSSHILSEVGRYCKNAAVIREGRILVCDSVANLAYTGIKHITLRGVNAIPKIENMRDIKLGNRSVEFYYSGKADELIKSLSSFEFEDITVTDPDLDEVFMHYYSREVK